MAKEHFSEFTREQQQAAVALVKENDELGLAERAAVQELQPAQQDLAHLVLLDKICARDDVSSECAQELRRLQPTLKREIEEAISTAEAALRRLDEKRTALTERLRDNDDAIAAVWSFEAEFQDLPTVWSADEPDPVADFAAAIAFVRSELAETRRLVEAHHPELFTNQPAPTEQSYPYRWAERLIDLSEWSLARNPAAAADQLRAARVKLASFRAQFTPENA